ncbi:MAG: S-methyl-5'-thioinosine phosphorylase, partial [Methylophilaceae bacterium]|nr:S-methyl-5'-thioinosine phosphorylase [Methylophilaceae bacterium]
MLGIIGGTGLTQLANLNVIRRQIIRTPYGEPSAPMLFGELGGHEVVFLARHGGGHTIPPHAINYRANIWALHSRGVNCILAVATVGAIDESLNPGDIVLPEQLIDYTHSRKQTFFDGVDMPVRHTDFTEPYSHKMRSVIIKAAKQAGEPLKAGGVYAAVQGPRLETAAEVNKMDRDGATIVG